MLLDFYKKVLPNEGYFCVAYNNKDDNRFVHQYTTTIEELVELIETHRSEERNVFVAMSSFNEQKREASKTLYVKSFYIDLDVGEAKEYQTQKEALVELGKFLETTKLPTPAIINSGNGIHAYWAIDEKMTVDVWKPLAIQLKNLCAQHNLKIDMAITADSARLLRCPDTNNYKQHPSKPTLIISDAPEYKLGDIQNIIEDVGTPLEEIVKKMPMSDNNKAKYSNYENHFKPLLVASMTDAEDGCGQIKNYIQNVKTAEEPLWWRVLSLANNCVDRDEVIHVISKDHPGYSPQETEAKATGAPKTCKDFNSTVPGICTSCNHWEKISTPIQLHKVAVKLKEEEPLEGEHLPTVRRDPQGLPESMDEKGYWIGAKNGGVFKSVTIVDKKGVSHKEDKVIYEYTMKAVRHVRSSSEGNCLVINVWHPHDGLQEFILPMTSVYEKSELRKALTSQGIYYQSSEQEAYIMEYFIEWAKDMQKKNKYDVMYDQMGWNEDKSSFVVGSTEINRDGTEKSTPISAVAKSVAPFLSQSGSFEGWQEAAQKLNQNGLEMHMFTMMCGFGSILMDFSSTAGVAISLTGESGAAKTGALYGALSIWGQPKDLSVMNTTASALIGRFLTLHNLPFGFDEVGNKNPYLLSDFILAVSQGKAKLKMQASTNAERDYEAPASLIAIMTSNHSIYDKLKTIRSNPNGEAARLIEFPVRKPKAFIDDSRLGKEIFDQFNSHYGWAGSKFVKAVYDYGTPEDIKENLAKWENRFVKDFGNDTAYRFYENLVAVTMTAAEIVNSASILTVDIERVYNFVVGEMIQIRDEVVKVNNVDYEAIMQDYIDANLDKILTFDNGKIVTEPHRAIVARVDWDKDYMYLSKREYDAYLAEKVISTKEFVFQLKQAGVDIQAGADVKQRMNAGWKDVTKSATAVYKIRLSSMSSGFRAKQNAASQ